ncbi:hypothetical protein DL96DRAFT_1566443 [Flagelloscypha sp. PMI_526]|nr:hypothetical protein DL96DRAFT_1566443 [Flagelloscypha sp. PMI_526]
MSLGPAYTKIYGRDRSIRPDVFGPVVSFSGKDPSPTAISNSPSPTGSSIPTQSISDSWQGWGSGVHASSSNSGDPKTQSGNHHRFISSYSLEDDYRYEGTQIYDGNGVGDNNSDGSNILGFSALSGDFSISSFDHSFPWDSRQVHRFSSSVEGVDRTRRWSSQY